MLLFDIYDVPLVQFVRILRNGLIAKRGGEGTGKVLFALGAMIIADKSESVRFGSCSGTPFAVVSDTSMRIIELSAETVTLDDVIELARQDPVSILTGRGEEIYVMHLGYEGARLPATEAQAPEHGAMTVAEVEEAIEEELARLEGPVLISKD